MTGFPDPAGGFDDADGRPAGLGGDPPGAGGANAPEGAEDPAGPGAAGAAVGYGGQEHLERLDRLGRFGRLGFEGAEGPADGADPLERVLRPAPGYLAPPPGAFERVRGRRRGAGGCGRRRASARSRRSPP
ncbi:hypothetical protein [Actinacidiphila yeochonensis]|uniref:hypothetical protein n=1 Tax=Actinacidiphila yeochonensis TaxID=89050 RepID=UPI00069134C5|nr:hypothetical protein [Actinacidiphila yeochonensis]